MDSYDKLASIDTELTLLCSVANHQLRGTNDLDAALVQQYVNLADNEILPSVCTWTFPTLGIMQYNKGVSYASHTGCIHQMSLVSLFLQNTEQAQAKLKGVLTILNNVLENKTFLVGERVTLADISCVCNLLLLYKQASGQFSNYLP